jgi:hypothetical protein
MGARMTTAAVLVVITLALGAFVTLAAPEQPPVAFWIASASLVVSLGALGLTLLRTVGTDRCAASLWLRVAPATIAAGWTALAFAQALSSQLWSWRLAGGLEILAGGVWMVVALGAGGTAAATNRESVQQDGANRICDCARRAADDLVRRCAGTAHAAQATRISSAIEFAPRSLFADPRAEKAMSLLSALAASTESAEAGWEHVNAALRDLGLEV